MRWAKGGEFNEVKRDMDERLVGVRQGRRWRERRGDGDRPLLLLFGGEGVQLQQRGQGMELQRATLARLLLPSAVQMVILGVGGQGGHLGRKGQTADQTRE